MMAKRLGSLMLTVLLTACVTINIYFPAAQAQEAAEMIVEDILQKAPSTPVPKGDKGAALDTDSRFGWAETVLDFVVPSAHAAQPDFSVNTPQIRQLQASLKQRHAALAAYFDKGAVGFTHDGRVAIRDAKSIGLRDRAKVKKLLDADNRERDALYQAIAAANGHPEWEGQVRDVFARTWIDKAQSGWYHRTASGSWMRK